MRFLPVIGCLLICFVVSACSSVGTLTHSLKLVETPDQDSGTGREYNAITISGADASNGRFSDEHIEIVWTVNYSHLSFTLTNKTDKSILVVWDEATYVDVSGNNSRAIHYGVKYADKALSQPPSVIIKRSKLEDVIVPTNNIHFLQGWTIRPLFKGLFHSDRGEVEKNCAMYKGKDHRVLLPLNILGKRTEYLFTFEISDCKLRK